MNRTVLWTGGAAVLALALAGLSYSEAQIGPPKPPPIVVTPDIPEPQVFASTSTPPLDSSASYAWSAFLAINWPASGRGQADKTKNFGAPAAATVWQSWRSKVELFPGNGSATVPPHGVKLDPKTQQPIPPYNYGQAPAYAYAAGAGPEKSPYIAPCAGQEPVATPAFINLDETTEIGNNQTFAGIIPNASGTKSQGAANTKPGLIRYAVKMNEPIYNRVIQGLYWHSEKVSPLSTAEANYTAALAQGQSKDPTPPYVNYAPTGGDGKTSSFGMEVKSAWRPITDAERHSGRFYTAKVRWYEQADGGIGKSCYREGTWGLVGMHMITFSRGQPWVIWSTFEQADNILTLDGKPTEDVDGNIIVPTNITATTPALSSNPNVLAPTVTAAGGYCTIPGKRLFFQENPHYGTMPSAGNICVNLRWRAIGKPFLAMNAEAHAAIKAYLAKTGQKSSPWLYYKLIGAQGVPVDASAMNAGTFSTTQSYYMANSVIETDYSLGNFTGNLVNGAPSNVQLVNGKTVSYDNTTMLPFQANTLGDLLSPTQMGGCAGCHGFAAQVGQGFSFALGDNQPHPEPTNAFGSKGLARVYFPLK